MAAPALMRRKAAGICMAAAASQRNAGQHLPAAYGKAAGWLWQLKMAAMAASAAGVAGESWLKLWRRKLAKLG